MIIDKAFPLANSLSKDRLLKISKALCHTKTSKRAEIEAYCEQTIPHVQKMGQRQEVLNRIERGETYRTNKRNAHYRRLGEGSHPPK